MLFKKKPKLSLENVMAAHPVRNGSVTWEETDAGEVMITIRPRTDRTAKWLKILFPPPPERKVSLDEVGSEVWRLCDGKTTVDQIVKKLARRYKLNRREAETSTTEYLRRLGKRRLVGFMVADRKT